MTQNSTAVFEGSISDAESQPTFLKGLYNLKEEPASDYSEEHKYFVHEDIGDNRYDIKTEEKDIKSECFDVEDFLYQEDPLDIRNFDVARGKMRNYFVDNAIR